MGWTSQTRSPRLQEMGEHEIGDPGILSATLILRVTPASLACSKPACLEFQGDLNEVSWRQERAM